MVRRWLPLLVIGAIVVVAVPRITQVAEVWPTITAMSWPLIVLLVLATAWHLVSYAFVLTAATPGLTRSQAMVVTQSSTAVANTVPGGGALGVGVMAKMYRSWGFSPSATSLAAICSGVWNTFAKLALPLLAFGLLAVTGDATWGRFAAAGTGILVVAAAVALTARAIRDDRVARRIASVCERTVSAVRRAPRPAGVGEWAERASQVRRETYDLLHGCWVRLTVATLLSQLSACVVLYLSLRGVGVSEASVGWIEVLAAFAFVRLLALAPLTPGGVGVVEVGLTVSLVSAGAPQARAVAAVLVFRAMTYVAPVIAGLPAYLMWKRHVAWRRHVAGATQDGRRLADDIAAISSGG